MRKCSLYGFLLVFLYEGNLEYLSYCSFNQLQNLFAFRFMDKINLVLAVLFLFSLVLFCFSIYFILLWYYKKASKVMMDDFYRNFESIMLLSLIFNYRYFFLGVVQSLLYYQYEIQIYFMSCIQVAAVLLILYCEINFGCIRESWVFHTIIMETVLKICLNFLLLSQTFISS